MEEIIQLPNAGRSITIFFCDNCNPDWDPTQKHGLFLGFWARAIEAGWQEREFGHLCSACIEAEDGEVQAMSPAEALGLLTGKANK